MDQTKDIVLTIPAEAQYVGVVRLTVSGIANRLGFHYDDIEDIKLAVAEACTNAVDHAYKELECQGSVRVTFRIFGDRLEIRVKDEGKSFDIEAVKKRSGPIENHLPFTLMRERGLGLHLMETLMDHVDIQVGKGVVVTLTKFIHRDEVDRDVNSPAKTESHG
ncbi:anti-sigma B factor RsbW [Kroppenstedtia eburnea]|uniref:Serine-protein kinase RsbW n=1 Tax=Kroppenstedtia eburnea TaxID=714067 RepID=A0A1N7P4X8_9BACL|nr:anti-sigma B factor RsbW [Kroppenstedtia eburnea]EGK09502.1 anti-sigma B factor [Desmospora sp. 8437]QKI80850.1 anti-sigma B factor RsbW [Kroppenstedtia eburnea]SIT05577.1 serine/threonine-protein kinase RsbW [Kroppenstedtia eburnea]